VRWKKWALVLGLLVVASWFTGLWIFWLPLALMAVLIGGTAFAVFEYGTTNFALEVWDQGEALEVLRRGQRESIPLGQLAEVSYAGKWNPPRAYLRLRRPCRWGTTVTFLPDCSGGRDQARAMMAELDNRIERVAEPDRA
jgi:hypothetical protein